MRLIKFRDSESHFVGFGLQWGDPLNLEIVNRKEKRLGLVLNFRGTPMDRAPDQLDTPMVAADNIDRKYPHHTDTSSAPVERTLVQICVGCRRTEADIYCRSHDVYLCAKCALLHMKTDVCNFVDRAREAAHGHM